MKERILELAEQQGFTGPNYLISSHELVKFAELIVRECCDIFVELRTRPADLAVKDVKKYFGVEE